MRTLLLFVLCLLAVVWQARANIQVLVAGMNDVGQFGNGVFGAGAFQYSEVYLNDTGNVTLAHGSNPTPSKPVKIVASSYITAVLFENGTIATAGDAVWTHPTHKGLYGNNIWVPLLPCDAWPDNEPFSDVWASAYGLFALTNNTKQLLCWGYNVNGNLGDPSRTDFLYNPDFANLTRVVNLEAPIDIADLSCREYGCVALLKNGTVLYWGFNSVVKGGPAVTPSILPGTEGVNMTFIASCYDRVVMYSSQTDKFYTWGYVTNLNIWDLTATELPPRAGTFAAKTISDLYCVALTQYVITAEGELWTWGSNSLGEFGNGTWTTEVTLITDAQQVPLGFQLGNFAALTTSTAFATDATNGTLYGWGDATFGIMGISSLFNMYSPTQLPYGSENITNVVAIGGFLNSFLITDDTVYSAVPEPPIAPPVEPPASAPVDPPVFIAPTPVTPGRTDLLVIFTVLFFVVAIAIMTFIW